LPVLFVAGDDDESPVQLSGALRVTGCLWLDYKIR